MDRHDATDRHAGVNPPAPTDKAGGENPSLREWFARNGTSLAILAALFLFLFVKFEPDDLWSIAKAALGLGFVIFIHELGHFAVAKWCDVHVETFSIGFGPALPGCKFKHGETTYMIALVPLGGYVKMVGESPDSEEGDDDPRSFKNKSVWQRMAIISAGVTMNILLAFLCFIVVFRGPGKKQTAGVVGKVVADSPAWEAKIPAGAWIHQVGSVHNPYFSNLLPEVMLSGGDEALPFVYSLPPHQEEHTVWLKARPDKTENRKVIGVLGSVCLDLQPRRYLKGRDHPVYFGGAAAEAAPPFEFEDRIIGIAPGDRRRGEWKKEWALPPDPRVVGPDQKPQPDYFTFAHRLADWQDREVTVRVRRKSGAEVNLLVPRASHWAFGVRMLMGQITAVRSDAPGVKWTKPPVVAGPRRAGDIIERVEVKEPDGKVTTFRFPRFPRKAGPAEGKEIDPMRLRFELQQWAARVKDGDKTVTLLVRRDNRETNGEESKEEKLQVQWQDWDPTNRVAWKYAKEVPLSPGSPVSVPELGICYQVQTTVAGVDPSGPGRQQPALKEGDVIKGLRFRHVAKNGKAEEGSWATLERDEWAHYFWSYQHYVDHREDVRKIDLKVVRSGKEIEVTLDPEPDRSWPLEDRGLVYSDDKRVQRADSVGQAVVLGLEDTWTKVTQVYKTLRGIITRDVSPKNLGGPITIARVAFSIAGENFWEFIYFLGLISINLAVVNFLPIPVLDGGHMVFLIYEKIRGKPASEQVRTGATVVGLVLLASLMIFVIYLDVSRIVGK